MSLSKDKIIDKLLNFGLEEEESSIYLRLLSDSPKSVLELSRELKLGRNVVYRYLEKLADKNLIKNVKSSSGLKVAAGSHKQLEKIIEDKETELKEIKASVTDLFGSLAEIASAREQGTIKYYSGNEGMLQITLNSLQARREILLYAIGPLETFMSHDTAEKIRRRFVENEIITKQITNKKEVKRWTDVIEQVRHYWEPRYVSPDLLSVDYEFIIYNDVVAMYTVDENGQLWGLEVESKPLAYMQRQLFNYVWANAAKMKIINNSGHAKVQ